MIKPLLVHGYYRASVPSGEATVFEAERAALVDAGHDVVVYARRAEEVDGPAERAAAGVGAMWSRRVHREISELIRREGPTVAHFHNTFPLISPSAYAACKELGVPVIQTLHNYRLLCLNGQMFRNGSPCHDCAGGVAWRGVARRCYQDGVAASAAALAASAAQRLAGIRRERVDLFVAPSEFARRTLVHGGIPSERIVVKPHFLARDPGEGIGPRAGAVFVGRLSAAKGTHTLVRAWDGIGGTVPLTVFGNGRLWQSIEALARRDCGVRWEADAAREQVLSAIQAARILVFPSEAQETFGLALIEAFAAGTPVIVSDRGAPAEIVEHGRTGLVVPAGDADALARAVRRLASGPEAERMGREARRTFERLYAPATGYAALVRLYLRVTGAPSASPVRDVTTRA